MLKYGKIQKRILLLLLGGITLSFSKNFYSIYSNLDLIYNDWNDNTNKHNFNRTVESLSVKKLLSVQKLKNGSYKLILTKEGKKQAKVLKLLGNSIKLKTSKKWDKKWRIVAFDIPEKKRIFRDILRKHLYDLNFKKLQNSIFVSPHPFEKQIFELTHLYSAEAYVRVITANKIDNENELKLFFSI